MTGEINGSRARSIIADCTSIEIVDDVYYIPSHEIMDHGNDGKFEEVYKAELKDGRTFLYPIKEENELEKLREKWFGRKKNSIRRDKSYRKYLEKIVKTRDG